MRNNFLNAALLGAALALFGAAGTDRIAAAAETEQPTQVPAPAPAPTKSSVIAVVGTQNKLSARLSFNLDGVPNLKVIDVDDGIEIRSDGDHNFQLEKLPALRELAGVEVRTEGKAKVVLVRFAAECCEVQESRVGHSLKIDFIASHPKAMARAAGTRKPAPAGKAEAHPADAAKSAAHAKAETHTAEAAKPAPTQKAEAHTTEAAKPTPAAKTAAAAAKAKSEAKSELGDLRSDLMGKLAELDKPAATPTPASSGTAPTGDRAAKPTVAATKPTCPADFKMDDWRGSEPFAERLRALREATARSEEAPSAMAALAEFYVINAMGGEAIAAAQAAKLDGISAEDRRRLQRDADLGRLLKGARLAANSVLLDSPADCDRSDVPLWRALSAAASGDQETIRREADAAGRALLTIPEAISGVLAFRVADAVPDDKKVLKAMANAVRTAAAGGPQDTAARFLLQAHIAQAAGDDADYLNFLQRAATDLGITGLKAKAEIAESHVQEDSDEGRRSEALLADTARVYRDTGFGRRSATVLSELKLQRGDYIGALHIATDTAPLSDTDQPDSHGAALAARVLRQLLVDKSGPKLPSPEQRLIIYWHYSGYATPGEKGDDIRMGAAELMIDQGMPEAAVEVMRQVSPQSTATSRGAVLYARAEAGAGNPDRALTLLKGVPSDTDTQQAAADALAAKGKPVEAARQLGNSADLRSKLMRASLLYQAQDWAGAADAYAAVLRDPGLAKESHGEAADRYGLAIALSGKPPADDLKGGSQGPDRVLVASPGSGDNQQSPIAALRESLRRAAQIEAMLPPGPSARPAGG